MIPFATLFVKPTLRHMLLLACTMVSGCSEGVIENHTLDDQHIPDFEEFEQNTYREANQGPYIVDGDTVIPNKEMLRTFYDSIYSIALANQVIDGISQVWSNAEKMNLSYCISNDFGDHKNEVVTAMAMATNIWEGAANIHFEYDSSQDSLCTAENEDVLFNITPATNKPYAARAFFPKYERKVRQLLITDSAYNNPEELLPELLTHEVGHILGFAHEHARPQAGHCFKHDRWSPLTPYDSASVMHYPECNGTSHQSYLLSALDAQGAAALYGLPSTGKQRNYDGLSALTKDQIFMVDTPILPGSTLDVGIIGTGNINLYIRFNAPPTATEFDCRPFAPDSTERCQLIVPSNAHTVYLGLHGVTAAEYILTASWVEPQN